MTKRTCRIEEKLPSEEMAAHLRMLSSSRIVVAFIRMGLIRHA